MRFLLIIAGLDLVLHSEQVEIDLCKSTCDGENQHGMTYSGTFRLYFKNSVKAQVSVELWMKSEFFTSQHKRFFLRVGESEREEATWGVRWSASVPRRVARHTG